MKLTKLNGSILIGLIAIIGILIAQLLWTREAFNSEDKKFSQRAHIALLEVAKKLYRGTNLELPGKNPVQKISNDYYIVNVDNDFEPEILEFYLISEFRKMNITTDFEYAMYNCQSDEMVYGNYISLSEKKQTKHSVHFPKHRNFVYYFAIRFPNETGYLFSSLRFWFVLSIALIIILLVYVYSIFTLLQQKKYSDLQRDFINNMTHEFKTPLSSILIASNYLYKQDSIRKDEKLEKYTHIIIDQSNKLNQHIEKILNIAKSDNTPLVLNKKNLYGLPILESVIENIQLKHPESEIKIVTDLESASIEADEFHFTNLVYNLLDNAIKYSDNKPEINIAIAKAGKYLQFDFIDNGIGISSKNTAFVFDKFYRIPSQKSNEVTGFGLGLYYSKKVCDLHNWKIYVKCNPEKGCTFSLLIPQK
ncbi:sensor histidine kinase [Flavobacterium aquicola]|uniref:histidine kinase n=1 Tax=Flavobacterium aquicola TaxID=1682742 RepID=A0A3E0EUU5_9FLAO|nr:HAMP domain-containing sensor histidine kinase [Flavobacterium aquicola]REH01200.1 two-component system phosphate regulon sensor histidine kinase PhoR [Flavobacterium aquicola]